MKRFLPLIIIAITVGGGMVAISSASPPHLVTPSLLARGTFEEDFNVRSDNKGPIDVSVKSKSPMDLVVRKHTYEPDSYTGWHTHPGPVFITVTQGSLTFYSYKDGECQKETLTADPATGYQPGYVDDGRGHFVRNESGAPAEDVSVITSPTKPGLFRGEIEIPDSCGFPAN